MAVPLISAVANGVTVVRPTITAATAAVKALVKAVVVMVAAATVEAEMLFRSKER